MSDNVKIDNSEEKKKIENSQEVSIDKKTNNQKQMAEKKKHNIKKLIRTIVAVIIIFISFKLFFPEHFLPALNMSGLYAKEMISIFPAVLLMMGLADVWIPASLIKKYMGKNAGISGKILSVALGTLPTGPMYIALPLAAELLRKKASISNVIIFLGVWASLKIPQIGIEMKFLGIKFAFLRFVFTLISIFIIGFIIEKLVDEGGEPI